MGWRRAAKQLRRDGHSINNKRVRWLWRDEGLQVPQKSRRPRLTGIGVPVGQMCPIAPDAIWAMDFQFDRTIGGRQVRLLNVIDEFPRALATEVEHSIGAHDVVGVLDVLAATRGVPAFIRFDNGPEFMAHAVADWCAENGTGAVFIDPGSPWQNAWIESFNGKMRDKLLNLWQFDSLREAQVIIEDWRIDYNINRPHDAHGEPHPDRVRPSLEDQAPTPTRITAGPPIGTPSPHPRRTCGNPRCAALGARTRPPTHRVGRALGLADRRHGGHRIPRALRGTRLHLHGRSQAVEFTPGRPSRLGPRLPTSRPLPRPPPTRPHRPAAQRARRPSATGPHRRAAVRSRGTRMGSTHHHKVGGELGPPRLCRTCCQRIAMDEGPRGRCQAAPGLAACGKRGCRIRRQIHLEQQRRFKQQAARVQQISHR